MCLQNSLECVFKTPWNVSSSLSFLQLAVMWLLINTGLQHPHLYSVMCWSLQLWNLLVKKIDT